MPRKIHISFDNFTTLHENTSRWMTPEQLAALPELSDHDEDLWQNYLRAEAAHKAACLAVQYRLRYPTGPVVEVERMGMVIDELWEAYCDWTNIDRIGTSDEDVNTKTQEIMEKIRALLEKERERSP